MKKLILLMVALVFTGITMAQKTSEPKPVAKPAPAAEKSNQPKVGVKEEKATPMQMPVEKAGQTSYECPKCHAQADKPGKCSHCKVDMIEAKKHNPHGNGHQHNEGDGHKH